ncbi:MAG: Ig-like domain-containing protein [Bacteroidia bacterium]|nr:Ig-like domain-containing protein [Bacteroidia bacterium]
MRTTRLLTAFAFVSVVLITGCKKDDFKEITGVCPAVISTSPANAATGVPIDKVITVIFNEKMNPETINQATFTLQEESTKSARNVNNSISVSGTVTYSGVTASFIPTIALTSNTSYTGRISSTVRDLMASSLQTDYVWTFTTGSTLAPTVISTDPTNNATMVFLNKTITANFSVPMDPLSITTTSFTIESVLSVINKHGSLSVAGTVSYTGTAATFAPSGALALNTIYVCTITTGAKNLQGTSLANDYLWTFTTGSVLAPEVISTDPANNASGVVLNKKITVSFSESMNPLTITESSFILKQGLSGVPGTISYNGNTATFTPFVNLLSGATYTGTITTGAENQAGNALANDYVWNFSTTATLGAPVVDLKSVGRFGIIAGVGVSNDAGFSEIHDMDVGISPGVHSSVTGFPPAIVVNGAIYASDDIAPPGVAAMLIQAKQDLTDAYLFAEGATSPAPATVSGDLGGTTLAPGIYKSTSTLLIQSGNLTLDAQGDVNAVWIFQVASGFTTVGGAGGSVILSGGARADNVFWQVGSSATIGDFTSFYGNVLALTSITMNSGATATGRMLARNGSVVLTSTNIITKP